MNHTDSPFPCPGAPDLPAAGEAFSRLCATVAALRDKTQGCPWDLQQDHRSLRTFMLEEAYETVEVMDDGKPVELCEELGDVLFQVVLNAQVALDAAGFSIVDVVSRLDSKLRRRHPHVFGSPDEQAKRDMASIHKSWQDIKKHEKAQKGQAAPEEGDGLFRREEVEKIRPATTQAYKIGELAARIAFDWKDRGAVWQAFLSEVRELAAELTETPASPPVQTRIEDELGDLYFSLAQVCRHLGLQPEVMAQHGNHKFLKRFAQVEKLAKQRNWQVDQLTQKQLEGLWQEAKDSAAAPHQGKAKATTVASKD